MDPPPPPQRGGGVDKTFMDFRDFFNILKSLLQTTPLYIDFDAFLNFFGILTIFELYQKMEPAHKTICTTIRKITHKTTHTELT